MSTCNVKFCDENHDKILDARWAMPAPRIGETFEMDESFARMLVVSTRLWKVFDVVYPLSFDGPFLEVLVYVEPKS